MIKKNMKTLMEQLKKIDDNINLSLYSITHLKISVLDISICLYELRVRLFTFASCDHNITVGQVPLI